MQSHTLHIQTVITSMIKDKAEFPFVKICNSHMYYSVHNRNKSILNIEAKEKIHNWINAYANTVKKYIFMNVFLLEKVGKAYSNTLTIKSNYKK